MSRTPRPRLLCATHVVPAPARAGNEYRIQRLLLWLNDAGWDVRLVVCPATPPTDEQRIGLAELPFLVEVCPHDEGTGEDDGPVAAADERVQQLVRGLCPMSLVDRVAAIDAEWHPEVVLVQYAFLTRAFPPRAAGSMHPVRVVDTIDVFSTKAEKVEAHGVSDGYALTDAQEAMLLEPADLVVAIQPEEALALVKLVPRVPVITAGVDVAVARTVPRPQGPVALVVASANPMNAAGLRTFLDDAWPRVRAAEPDAVLRVVGPVAATLDGEIPAGVEVVGPVAVLAGEYANAHVVVNPVPAGTGVKVKTLEGVANARTVVCWPAGVDGVPSVLRDRCVVVDEWSAFADAVVASLRTPPNPITADEAAALAPATVYATLGRTLDALVAGRGPRSQRTTDATGLRVLSLMVQHGTSAYPDARRDLHDLMTRRLPLAEHRLLLIDNAGPPAWQRLLPPARRQTIRGSNSAWEFSAWDDGIRHLGDELDGFDAVALVTSAFLQFDAQTHLELLSPEHVERVRNERVALGHIDHFDEPVWFDGVAMQSWLRSSFVLVAPDELRRLGTLVSVQPATTAALFSDDPRAPFSPHAPLSPAYQGYLRGWLTGDGTGQGVEWHSRFDLDAATLPKFRSKATAILNEQLLTHRLRVQGCAAASLTTTP